MSRRFEVFDFTQDDVVVEVESAKNLAKFRNPKPPKKMKKKTKKKKSTSFASPLNKYTFLHYFTKGINTEQKKITAVVLEDDDTAREESSGLDAYAASTSSHRKNKQVCTISDDEDTLDISSPSKNEAASEEKASQAGASEYESVETALGNLHLESKYSRRGGNAYKTSGIEQLKCSESQEENKSLDIRYDDTWDINYDFDKPFKDVIYPKGDADAVTITKGDLERLQPETFINDTIIDFYILYLKNNIQPGEKHRFHFFNSFFFRKLADLEKDPSSSCQRKAAFQCIRKWTRKVNLFEKDYIFIPVNYSLHWSLIVICHPGEVANWAEEGIESLSKMPCILHMDSIKGSHKDLENLVRRYLSEEWKERHGHTPEEDSLRFLKLRFFALELPQQENLFDCGLFLLHYVECFLKEAPASFKITESSNFLNKKWFSPAEASLKRFQIKKLVYDILDQSSEDLDAQCINSHPSSQVPNITEQEEIGIKLCTEMSDSTKEFTGNCSCSDAHGIIISSPQGYPPGQVQCSIDSGQVSEINHLPLIDSNLKSFMAPIQEVEDTGEKFTDSAVNIEAGDQGRALPSGFLPKSNFGEEFQGPDACCNHGFPNSIGDNADVNSVYDTSSSGSESLLVVDEHGKVIEIKTEHTGRIEIVESDVDEDLTGCVVQDSEEVSDNQDGDEVQYLSSSVNQKVFQQEVSSNGNINAKEINMLSSGDDEASESDGPHAPKRPRVTPPALSSRRLTRGLRRRLLHL